MRPAGAVGKALTAGTLVLLLALCLGCASADEDSLGTGASCSSAIAEPGGGPAASRTSVTLLRVVDGDTIWVRMPDGAEEKVRYIGIDTPELAMGSADAEYLAGEAAARNAQLLAAGDIELELDVEERDPYDRLLAYVWAGGVLVNEQLVLNGYARARDYPPNLRRQPQLRLAEDKAREAHLGIWAR